MHEQFHTPPPDDQLLDLVIEEVMRRTSDPTWVETALTTDPSRRQAFVGRWLGDHPPLTHGTPLALWAGHTELDPAWRARINHVPGNLWQQTRNAGITTRRGTVAYHEWKTLHHRGP